MIPAINPPTDNLYKFISLFGLAIFLFAIFMLSETLNQSNNLNVKHEEIIQEIRTVQLENTPFKVNSEKVRKKLRPFKALSTDINRSKLLLKTLNLSLEKEYSYLGKLNVLELQVNFFRNRVFAYWLLIGSGVILMVYGFIRWGKKDQYYRDEMLLVELNTKKHLEQHAKKRLDEISEQLISKDLICPACSKPIFENVTN